MSGLKKSALMFEEQNEICIRVNKEKQGSCASPYFSDLFFVFSDPGFLFPCE